MKLRSTLFATLALSMLVQVACAADWARFRGPNGTGISSEKQPTPVKFSDTENLKWKAPLPGPGSSSPIVVGDKVFVTCWSGYGTSRQDRGSLEDLKRHLICFDKATGKVLWDKTVPAMQPEDEYGGQFAQHGYASHTPASDGEHVYVFFGKTGVLAFDLQGQQLWQTGVGTESDRRGWGSASSPILYKDLVIVTAAAESQSIVALNKKDGKQVWKQEAGGFASTWGTPVLVKVDEERTDLVLGVPYEIWGFNPDNGKLRWYCPAMETDSYCSSVVAADGIVYGVEGRGGGSIALRVGGKDDISSTNVLWSGRDNNRITTPLVHEGKIYYFGSGVANCISAKDGKRVAQLRLQGAGGDAAPAPRPGGADGGPRQRGGPGGRGGRGGGGRGGRGGGGGDYASPVLADGKIYFTKRSGEIFVLQTGDKIEQLAVNKFAADGGDFSATPAISNGEIFVRSTKNLYCVSLQK